MVRQSLTQRRRKGSRQLVGALAFGAVAVTLAACSTPSGTTSTGAAGDCTPNKDGKLNLAFIYATTSQNPMQEMALGAQAAADEDGNVNLQLLAPGDVDGAKEVQMLISATSTATDGIAWESVTPDLFLRPLQNVKAAGIPLIAVDNMTPQGVEPDQVVSNSNTDLGTQLGEAYVATNPPKNGKVVLILDIPTLQLLVQRLDGAKAAIAKALPDVTFVGPIDGKSSAGQTANTAAIQAAANANPDATAIIGVGGPDGISFPLIKSKSGATWAAGSADIPPEALDAVKSGSVFALSSPEHWMKGYIAVKELIDHARTCKAIQPGWWNSGNLLIDKTNIDQVIARQVDNKTRFAFFKSEIDKQLANPPIKPFSDLN